MTRSPRQRLLLTNNQPETCTWAVSCSHNYGIDTHTTGHNLQLRLPPHHPSLMKNNLFDESTRNKNHYRNFIDKYSGRLDLLAHKYLHNKLFDHAAGDLIPQITSNAIQKPIHIYSERDGGIWKKIVQPTMPRNINKSPLLVHLKDYHYSAHIKEKNASIDKISASR
ncbi:hypothetical protein FHG87_013772 [Trinorchestia longiramus]|nr:hypothetical protein FHG87_013772 [Trinorchestia longiramus]